MSDTDFKPIGDCEVLLDQFLNELPPTPVGHVTEDGMMSMLVMGFYLRASSGETEMVATLAAYACILRLRERAARQRGEMEVTA